MPSLQTPAHLVSGCGEPWSCSPRSHRKEGLGLPVRQPRSHTWLRPPSWPPLAALRTLAPTWLHAALASQPCSFSELSQPLRVALAASTKLWILSPRLGPDAPLSFLLWSPGRHAWPQMLLNWLGRVGGGPSGRALASWAYVRAAVALWAQGLSPPPPPHSPSIVDQQPRSDVETEEFLFGWDPDERPLPVSDTLCYPKGLMFLPLQAWGGAQVTVPRHVPSELGD